MSKEVINIDIFFEKKSTKGRPRLILTEDALKLVESLSRIMCTEEEIASILNCSRDLFYTEDNKELYRQAIQKGQSEGKQSLRRYQYELAKKGNSSMLIWLGKQWLGQTDKIEQSVGISNSRQELKDYMECAKNGVLRKQETKKNRKEVREDN